MTNFILKTDERTLDFESLPPGQLKRSFFELRTAIDHLLQSRACDVHGSEPIVTLRADTHGAIVAGISTCCPEFAEQIHELLRPYWDSTGSDIDVSSRSTSYTYYS